MNYYIKTNVASRLLCLWKTLTLSTDADRSTDTKTMPKTTFLYKCCCSAIEVPLKCRLSAIEGPLKGRGSADIHSHRRSPADSTIMNKRNGGQSHFCLIKSWCFALAHIGGKGGWGHSHFVVVEKADALLFLRRPILGILSLTRSFHSTQKWVFWASASRVEGSTKTSFWREKIWT